LQKTNLFSCEVSNLRIFENRRKCDKEMA